MEYTRLGDSGLKVSKLILGCMSYGVPDQGPHEWSVDIDEARPFIRQAIEAGITGFDTANLYSDGTSEEITGMLLREFAPRDEVLYMTKVFGEMGPGPNGGGLSRGAILTQLDASLRRMGTDYIDLYQIHRLDHEVPMEEIMETLHDVIKAGKVRYIGASSMYAWEFAKLQHTADLGGWTRFVSMQNQYNLIQREDERELLPYCLDAGVGVIPWSPIARGRLARENGATSFRQDTDGFGKTLYNQAEESDRQIIDVVGEIAAERGIPRAQVALAWHFTKPAITAPIVGATKPHHLDDAVDALDVHLTEDEVARLEAPYIPRLPIF